MKFILFFLLLIYLVACSGKIEKDKAPEKEIDIIESPSANSLNPQINLDQERISGNGSTHISGAPSSDHISGQ